MKKILLLLFVFATTASMYSQTTKTVTIAAGELGTTLTSSELTSTTNLTINGSIDARDFKTMRDKMTALSVLNIEAANIAAYSGTEGTNTGDANYEANEVPSNAFFDYYKTSLTSISLPSTCTAIGEGAFLYCKKLETVKIPSSVSVIKASAFNRCEKLTSIQIPTSVTSIEKLAFSFTGLTSIVLPETITSLGESIFLQCKSLVSANIPASITEIPNSLFDNCIKLSAIVLPAKTTKIGDSSFFVCESLTTINIPASVTFIDKNGISNCHGLKSIYMNTSTPPTAASNAFYGTFHTCMLYVPTGSKSAYASANEWRWFVVAGNYDNITEYTPNGINDETAVAITLHNSGYNTFTVGGLNSTASYSIINLEGKIVQTGTIANNDEITMSSLVKGVHIVTIADDSAKASFKLINK